MLKPADTVLCVVAGVIAGAAGLFVCLSIGIGPALAGLTLKAETARALLPPGSDGASRQLRDLSEEIRRTVVDVRRLVDLAFLSPELVEVILHGRQPVELTATRLTELDLPLDWTDQRSLLASR